MVVEKPLAKLVGLLNIKSIVYSILYILLYILYYRKKKKYSKLSSSLKRVFCPPKAMIYYTALEKAAVGEEQMVSALSHCHCHTFHSSILEILVQCSAQCRVVTNRAMQCTMHLPLHSFSLKLCRATIDLKE